MRIANLRATPVAIGDPPLRSAFGLHAPFALRTIVEVELDDGNVGIGETYGGEAPLRALERARPAVVGRDPWQLTPLRIELERLDGNRPAGFAWESRALAGPALFSAIEVACLDAIGRASGRPVADLLGGRVRDRVPFAAYLFFKEAGDDEWGQALTPEELVKQAEKFAELFGMPVFKVKGGVLEPDLEVATVKLMRERFGPRMQIGCAGENIVVETDGRLTLDDLRAGLAIRAPDGAERARLQVLDVAHPCRPFTGWALGGRVESEVLKAHLQFLEGGTRGFYCLGVGTGIVSLGDRVVVL